MSSENLRFSVEESVWFQKGQEVSELISISLDPDIVIQEHDQYVSIRGALQLTGEYRIDENNAEEGERDFASVRLVNEVITREDGISELNHRFPVDITIPQDRVQSLDDVYVLIETFDYEIPKRGCLQIVADLAISGIQGVTQASKEEASLEAIIHEEQTPVAVEQPAEEELEFVRSSLFDDEEETQVVAEINDEDEEVHVAAKVTNEAQEEVVLQNEKEVVLHSEVEEQDVIVTREQQEDEAEADLFVPFEVEARKEVYQEQHEELDVVEAIEEEEIQAVLTPTIEVKARHDNQLSFGSDQPNKKSSTAVQEKEVVQEHREGKTEENVKRSENDLLLTKIFGRDEVDDHTTMKICIVQHGDSLEKIAQRYEISVQQLVRVNSLNTDSVSEGQLLYIPVQANT
ncbi:stage VI sporulation protein D [Fredinandcohnia sp. QZ13]|uniref:stage VI sporulation protein D n=1 Tax=Fredinandcohnia sp. QZ13 TaxID=3073144 RepID=UPI002853011C|nr:stage VI sporulation protein D [Fredinandcohnia sp. QZ13]MDR4889127.1 stage VI sporulation protein D [Fredinandcohnia sp. QZ13]